MAPPTGPRRGASSNNNSTSRSRGSRGGIAKRGRSSTGRVDRDGDLDMDATAAHRSGAGAGANKSTTSSARRGASRSSNGPTRASTRLQQNINRHLGGDISQIPKAPQAAVNTTIKILGLKASKATSNTDGGIKNLIEFLEKKATNVKNTGGNAGGSSGRRVRPVVVKKSLIEGDYVYILASNQDAEEILKVNGFTFAGAVLTITKSEEGWPSAGSEQNGSGLSSTAQQDKLKLRSVLERRYNPQSKLLDLSALGQDPILMEMGLLSHSPETAEKTFKVLMVICRELFKTAQEKRDAMESVSLAANNLDSLNPVFDLAETFPDLKHLDLSNNSFSALRQLNKWRGRFRRLETLLLLNNPILQTEPGHSTDIVQWFPKLQNLSNTVVRTPEQVAAAEEKTKVKEIPQNGNDFRDVNGLGQDFVCSFFPLFDTDRNLLLQTYYDEHSTFTLSVVNGVPKDPDTAVLPWAPYLGFSRNHQRITTEAARFQRYLRGIKIQELWAKLPATQHPTFDSPNKYLIDCHPMKGLRDPVGRKQEGELGMVITMHGEFLERQADGQTGQRSFSRTFVLGPSLSGRGPIRVISDMLSLHAYNPLPTVAVSSSNASAGPPAAAAPVAAELSPEQQQQMMVVELCKRTNMTAEYSKMCLDGAQWNFERALAIFEEKKTALPAEAFVQI